MTNTSAAPLTPPHTDRRDTLGWIAAVAAVAAGLCAIGLAIYQVVTPGPPEPSYQSAADWARELLFTGFLLGSIAGTAAAMRHGLAPRVPAWLVMAGYGLITVGVVAGMALRDDPDWFMLLGAPGQLLSMTGFVWWAVAGWRRRILPGAVALLGGVGGVVGFVGAELGLSVLIGAFWLWLAARIRS